MRGRRNPNGKNRPEIAGFPARETVRKSVQDEPGVIRIRLNRKKKYTTSNVPE
jgi:hypothetical protein